MAQNLRQVGRAELTRSASAVAEAGQPHGLVVHAHPSWNEKGRLRGQIYQFPVRYAPVLE